MKYIFIVILFFIACQCAPDIVNYKAEECFYTADCLYRAEQDIVCDKLAESCRDAMKEKRYYEKLTFCSKTDLGEGFDSEKCRLYLNQK